MQHRTPAALAASALVLGGLAALTVAPPAGATGGWHSFAGAGFGAIPDGATTSCPSPGAARDVTFTVSGMPAAQLAGVKVSGLAVTHTFAGDVTATLIAPGGAVQQVLFGRTGAAAPANFGDSSNLAGPYTFTDTATPANGGWWQAAAVADSNTAVPAGDYFATARGEVGAAGGVANSLTGAFAGLGDPNGTWTLRFVDNCQTDTGSVSAATLELRTSSEVCAVEQGEVDFATARLTAATDTAAHARSARTQALAKVAAAKKAVKRAKHAGAAKRAKVRLLLTKAQGRAATATARAAAAETARTAATTGLTHSQAALTACQAE